MSGLIKGILFTLALGPLACGQAPVLRAGVSVQMAATAHASPLPQADWADALVIAVTAGGKVYLSITPVEPADLPAKLKGKPGGNQVFIKGDARARYAVLAKVMEAVSRAGFPSPFLLTAQKDTPEPAYPVPPKGLQVWMSPAAELRPLGEAGRVAVVKAAGSASYGDVVRLIDACRGAGAEVHLAPLAASN